MRRLSAKLLLSRRLRRALQVAKTPDSGGAEISQPRGRKTQDSEGSEVVGNTDAELDTATINRIQDISKLSQKDKELVFEFLDSFISNRKIKNVLQ